MGSKRSSRPQTFDRLSKKKPIEIRELIPLDDEAGDEFGEAQREWERCQLIGQAEDPERYAAAQAAYEAAEAKLRDNAVEVVFRSIGQHNYEKLRLAHPPTDEQIETHKKEHGYPAEYNADTFAPELIAASCVQPTMTPDEVLSLVTEHGWNAGEYSRLFQLALLANTQRRVANLAF